ncbi:MAG: hypothetical protein ACYTEQ_19710 [Planctomycetota bacterium]|jgi:hypothetical protein
MSATRNTNTEASNMSHYRNSYISMYNKVSKLMSIDSAVGMILIADIMRRYSEALNEVISFEPEDIPEYQGCVDGINAAIVDSAR